MADNKAGQPNRTAPHLTLRNAKPIIYQRSDSKRSQQHVNQFQEHLLFGGSCPETKRVLKAVCTHHNYQGTLLMLIFLAGCIDQDTHETYIGADTLAQRMGINRDTAGEQLKRLQDSGIVTLLGKRGRSDIRLVMLPCNHLDVVADSSGDSSRDSPADNYAESPADNYADTYPHYQVRKRTEQEQQQNDPAAGYSLADKQAFIAELNDKLPAPKRITMNSRVNAALDSAADNAMPLGLVLDHVHRKAKNYLIAGGIVTGIELAVDDYIARAPERMPKRQLVPCTGLAADVVCDNKTHTTIGSDLPVPKCPQLKGTS